MPRCKCNYVGSKMYKDGILTCILYLLVHFDPTLLHLHLGIIYLCSPRAESATFLFATMRVTHYTIMCDTSLTHDNVTSLMNWRGKFPEWRVTHCTILRDTSLTKDEFSKMEIRPKLGVSCRRLLQDGFTSTHAWDDMAMRCYISGLMLGSFVK